MEIIAKYKGLFVLVAVVVPAVLIGVWGYYEIVKSSAFYEAHIDEIRAQGYVITKQTENNMIVKIYDIRGYDYLVTLMEDGWQEMTLRCGTLDTCDAIAFLSK